MFADTILSYQNFLLLLAQKLLGSCLKLRHLTVYHVTTMTQVDALCALLNQIKENLELLKFQHCRFLEDQVSKINTSLHVDGPESNLVRHLVIISSSMLFQGTKQFMDFLRSSRYLKSLVLIDNELSPTATVELFSVITETLQSLVLLSLCDNELEGFPAPYSKKMLSDISFTNLKALDLSSNRLGVYEMKECLPYFYGMKLLKHINLSDNPIGDDGVRMLAPVLRTFSLLEVNVSGCNLSSNAACFLFDLLTSIKHHLKALNLSHNEFGRSVAIPLADFLNCGLVQRLDIGDIGLGSKGCLELHGALQKMPNMSHFILRENRLGASAALLISKFLSGPNSLKKLDFSSNLLDLQCLKSIASELQVCGGALELVDLRNNLVEDLELFRSIKRPVVLLSGVGDLYDHDP